MDMNLQIIERFDRFYARKIKENIYTMQMKGSSEKIFIDEAEWRKVGKALSKESHLLIYGKRVYDEYMKKTYPGWYPEWIEEEEKREIREKRKQ